MVMPSSFRDACRICAIDASTASPDMASQVVLKPCGTLDWASSSLALAMSYCQARRVLVVVRRGRHHERVRHGAVAEQDALDQRLPVDGVGDGAAHVDVVVRLLGVVHHDVVRPGGREQVDLQVRRALELGEAGERRRLVDVRLPALQLDRAGVAVRDHLPGDPVQVRLARLPVGRVLLQGESAALLPVAPHERAGRDRGGVELVLGLARVVLGDDAVVGQLRSASSGAHGYLVVTTTV